MSIRTEHATVMYTNVEAHPEGIELTTEGVTLILQGSPAELANLASDLLASIATLARQQHDAEDEGSAEDASRPCLACGDEVATLSSYGHCDACMSIPARFND